MKDSDPLQDIGMQFTDTLTRIKHCQPLWVDLHKKSVLFNDRMRMMCASYGDYLDCLRRVIDVSQHQDGGAKDLGPILTKMYVKQRNMETKLQDLGRLLNDGYNMPMKDKLKEWKETCDYLDTKHSKETKRRAEEVRKAVTETERLKKKVVKKGKTKKQGQLCDAERSKETMLYSLQQFEQHALRGALLQERTHFCTFVNMMTPAWETECEIMDEGTHLRDVLPQAIQTAALPTKLPADAEASIHKIRLVSTDTTFEGSEMSSTSNVTSPRSTSNGQLSNNTVTSPRSSFISTNSSSTSGVSSGGSFGTLPKSPKDVEPTTPNKYSCTQFSSFDNLARSYPGSDRISSGYGSSPSVCHTTRGVVADINKFVEESHVVESAPPPTTDVAPPLPPSRKRGSGEYSSLSPELPRHNSMTSSPRHNSMTSSSRHSSVASSTRHSSVASLLRHSSVASSVRHDSVASATSEPVPSRYHSMETYENLGDVAEPEPNVVNKASPYFGITAPPNESLVPEPDHEPLYENIGEQESLYDVPPPPVRATPVPPVLPTPGEMGPPSLPPSRSASLCRRGNGGDTKGNKVNAYLERRRSALSQNRSNGDLRGSQEHIHSSRHSLSNGSHYATSRPTSMCSNHSNTDTFPSNTDTFPGNTDTFPSSTDTFPSNTDTFPGNNTSGNCHANYYSSNGSIAYSVQQFVHPKSNGYPSRCELPNSGGPTHRNHGYAVQDTTFRGQNAADKAAQYAVQQRRSESRLSLKSQPPHYATMTARPNKRTYSLTSLNYVGSSNSLHHSSTHSLDEGTPAPLSAVDPSMPPPPPPEVGQELAALCNQITRGGTLRPSQMRMIGMKPGDTSTIKRKDTKRDDSKNFDSMISYSNDMHYLNLNK